MKLIGVDEATVARRAAAKRRANPLASGGFTLIELMIVIAIVAILAAVAYPSYRDSVLKGKRAEGRAAVLDLLQQQERFLTQSNSYMKFGPGAAGLNGTIADSSGAESSVLQNIPFKTKSGDTPTSAAYNLSAAACAGTTLRECVRIQATPTFADPKVNNIFATSAGEKSCDGSMQTACWK